MTNKYTPETIDIKVAYCSSFDTGFAHRVMAHTAAEMTTGHAGDFDRWLTQHDAEVHRLGYEAARQDMLSGAFISGPTYEALANSFTGQQIAKNAVVEYASGRDAREREAGR